MKYNVFQANIKTVFNLRARNSALLEKPSGSAPSRSSGHASTLTENLSEDTAGAAARAGQRAELASGLKWHLAGSSDTASPIFTKTHPVNTENGTHAGHQQSPAGRISYSAHEPWRPQQTQTWKGSPDPGVPDLNQGKAYMPLATVALRTSHCPLRAGRASEGEWRLAVGEVRMHLLPSGAQHPQHSSLSRRWGWPGGSCTNSKPPNRTRQEETCPRPFSD